jgi:excisionase family DNA binding protein
MPEKAKAGKRKRKSRKKALAGFASPTVNSVETACFRLQICRATLYKLIAVGKINTVKFGSRRMIPEAEVLRIAEEGF